MPVITTSVHRGHCLATDMLDTDADVDLENPKRLFVTLEDRKFDASQAPAGPDFILKWTWCPVQGLHQICT